MLQTVGDEAGTSFLTWAGFLPMERNIDIVADTVATDVPAACTTSTRG